MFATVVRAASRSWGLQWDFKTYLLAARAAAQGLNPYDIESLGAIGGRPAPFPWLYPPITLLPFQALAHLPLPAALATWAALKIAATGRRSRPGRRS